MTLRIRDIFTPLKAIRPDTSVSAARQMFMSSPELTAVPVTYEAAPLGLLMRSELMEMCANAPDFGLLGRQPVARVMSKSPFLADISAPAAYIAKTIADQNAAGLANGAIVIEDGRYVGYVSSIKLLSAVSHENAARALAMKGSVAKLDKARQESIDARREQARFMAFLGHEIRTPLTGILGIADLLGDKKLPAEAQDYARTISESGQHLDRLLGDFLDLSRLEVGKLSIMQESFKVSDFVKDTRMLWAARAGQKGVGLKVTLDDSAAGRVEGDATRLRQILFNLIANAMKFTDQGSVAVHICTRLAAASALNLEMTVSDTGIGIADGDKARLFEAFEQATLQTMHRYGGTGLGLSIAKGLVERMGGQIKLSDNPGGGSVFHVVCPVRKAGPRLAVENKPSRRSANLKLGRILLVEDHDVSRLVITEALKAVGWTIDSVETADQAYRRGRDVSYQAILSDLHLGDVSGIDLVRKIRGHAGPNQHGLILAVTADVSDARMRQCAQAGFSGFIEKPIRPRNLVAKLVDAVLAHSEAGPLQARLKAV